MEKKKFKVTLKSGLHSKFEAENLEQLQEKIRMGLYYITPPHRKNYTERVTEETVSSIEEIKENPRL